MAFRRFKGAPEGLLSLTGEQEAARADFLTRLETGDLSLRPLPCVCGQSGGRRLAAFDRYGIPTDTLACRNCGMLRSDPVLDDASLELFYSEIYRRLYSDGRIANQSFWEEQERHGRLIVERLTGHGLLDDGMTVFDIGCGAGGALSPFRDLNCRVFGCDWGQDFLDYGIAAGLCLKHGSCESLREFAPADVIILNHVLEHFVDPVREIGRIRSLMKPGSLLYVEVPGLYSIHATYGDFFLYLQNAHAFHYNLRTLKNLMAAAGFRMVLGNEEIWSVWKTTEVRTSPVRTNRFNYLSAVAYLWTVEMARRCRVLPMVDLAMRLRSRIARQSGHGSSWK